MQRSFDIRNKVEDVELSLLLDGIHRHYGYDFRQYARPSLRRRIACAMRDEGVETISELQSRVLHSRDSLQSLLDRFSVSVSSMFRDPTFYRALREKVIPVLRTYPFIRIWVAGCAGGQEVYSLAIVLEEEGLLSRARIAATDMNECVVASASSGIYPLGSMRDYTRNYMAAGGHRAFSEYYHVEYDHAILRPHLKENIVFSQHNLVTDGPFNQFNLILCRNVMIYFNQDLQNQVLGLLTDSLARFGILALGRKETLDFTAQRDSYEMLDAREKLYRRFG